MGIEVLVERVIEQVVARTVGAVRQPIPRKRKPQ